MLNAFSPLRLFALLAVLALAACESAEERAEGHYQSALAFLEEGAREKAKIELRNVFQLNGEHQEARLAYATMLVEDNEFQEAIGQFLRLVEQNPEHLEGRRQLARLMLLSQNVEEAQRHIDAAIAIAPRDPELRTLAATTQYRRGEREAALAEIATLVEEDPGNIDARLVEIADRVNASDFDATLDLLDQALLVEPENLTLNALRLQALEQIGTRAQVGQQLVRMVDIDPDNLRIRNSLFLWHLQGQELDQAEAVLRRTQADNPENREVAVGLMRFLLNYRGVDTARAELQSAQGTGTPEMAAFYARLLAEFEFEQGDRDAAIALMEAQVASLSDGDDLNAARNQLAQFMRSTGDTDRAAELVEAVLESDENNVLALLERGRQRLVSDDYTGAIGDLRLALSQSPNNTAVLTLLARAHERNGSRDLARERLALAVEMSRQGVEESLRYAEFLVRDARVEVAEGVLTAALSQRPQDRRLLAALGQLQLAQEDWDGAEATAGRLSAIGTEEATRTAVALRSRALSAQNQFTASIDMLLGQLAEDAADIRALRDLTVTYLRAGETDQAVRLLQDALESDPGDDYAKLLLAGVYAVTSRLEEAENLYREIIAFSPEDARAWEALATLLGGTGRVEEAEAIIAEAANTLPDTPRIQVLYAGQLERAGDFEAAIAVYERLYALNSGSTIVANNLASLLAEHRDDQASLDRAAAVAQRLRVARNPAFLDTYGWVLYRQGNPEQALRPLQQAANALPDVALIEYHLGMVHAALGQTRQARTRLENALALAGETNLLPGRAREEAEAALAELPAEE
ncbi:MAG: tetratricopeptide repeat protein [Pseudomonadota bacterium]